MVIAVQGVGQNLYVSQTVATMSTMLALTKRKKTLVLQICNKSNYTVEDILRGKENTDAGIIADPNKGIDALLREVEETKLTSDLFDAYCDCIFETRNLLDIAKATPKKNAMPDFERACGKPLSVRQKAAQKEGVSRAEFKMLPMDMLLEEAKEVYDVVIISLTYCTDNVINYFTDYADVNVLVVPQGQKRDTKMDSKDILVIPNYQDRSFFTAKKVASYYGCKKVFPIAYNVDYNDASELKSLFGFISQNRDCDENDDNYAWSKNVITLVNELSGDKDPKEEIPFFELEEMLEGEFLEEETEIIEEITNDEIPPEEPKKKGFSLWKKKPKTVEEVSYEENFEEEDEISIEIDEETSEKLISEITEPEKIEEIVIEEIEEEIAAEPEVKAEPKAKPKAKSETKAEPKTKAKTDLKAKTEPKTEAKTETKTKTTSEKGKTNEKSKTNTSKATNKSANNKTRVEKTKQKEAKEFDLMAFLEED